MTDSGPYCRAGADIRDQTCWGSREGADVDDHLRLIELPTYEASLAGGAPLNPLLASVMAQHDDDDLGDRHTKAASFLGAELDWAETPLPPYSEADQFATISPAR